MKRVLNIILLLFAFWASVSGYRSEIYRAYVTMRMDDWKEILKQMEIQHKQTNDPDLLYQLTETQYGYIAYCLTEEDRKEASKWLGKAEDNITVLLETYPSSPRVYSLQGALYGYRVILEPLKAPVYGMKSINANKRAIRLGPEDPHVWMEKANMEFYKPAVLGGSSTRAIPFYKKAVELYEASPEQIEENWMYLNCLVNLGLAFEKDGQIKEAHLIYSKLMELEPSFTYVRDEIYPEFQEKHSRN